MENMKNLIPADTVDTDGRVWETTGENIRHGAKEFSENDVKALVNMLFPVGSVFCGENDVILSVGTWEQIMDGSGLPIILGGSIESGETYNYNILVKESDKIFYPVVRMFKRIK